MNQEKILNIVQFHVTDSVTDDEGNQISTSWEPIVVFSVDDNGKSSVEVCSPEKGRTIANENHMQILGATSDYVVTPEIIEKNYQSFATIAGFDPRVKPKSNPTVLAKAKDSVLATRPVNASKATDAKKSKSDQTASVGKATASKLDSTQDLDDDTKKDSIFKRILRSVAYPFIAAYGFIGKACDWATEKFLRPKKKVKKATLRDRFKAWLAAKKEDATDKAKKFASETVAMKAQKKGSKNSSRNRRRTTPRRPASKKGLFGRIATRVAAIVTSIALAFGLTAASPITNASAEDTSSGVTQEADVDVTSLTDEELVEMIQSGELSLDQVKVMLATGEITNDALDGLSFDQLLQVVLQYDIAVLCFGLRTDFRTNGFTGARRLLELSQVLIKIPTFCKCGREALFSVRKQSGKITFQGEKIVNNKNISYEALCPKCYYRKVIQYKKLKEQGRLDFI